MTTEIQVAGPLASETALQVGSKSFGWHDDNEFKHIQRVATMFSKSDLVPTTFQGDKGLPNCVIALEMSKRMNASPLAIMQQMYIVHGKPSWSSSFIISCINTCGKFSPLRFDVTGEGDKKTCVAWAIEKESGVRLEGAPVSIEMAKKEGWYGKAGSKWQSMPDLMLRYRAATFFGRVYAPELLMGMVTQEEAIDITSQVVASPAPGAKGVSGLVEKLGKKADVKPKKKEEKAEPVTPSAPESYDREAVIKACIALINSHKAKRVAADMERAGISAWTDGGDWKESTDDQLKALYSFLKC